MVEVNIITGKKARRLHVPESWEELDGKQFAQACIYRAAAGRDAKAADEAARRIIRVDGRTWRRIGPAQKCLMREELLGFILDGRPSFRDNKTPCVRAGLRRLHGFGDMLGDVTWEEFIFADTFMLKGMHREAIAVLYRPANPLTGKRAPFSDKGLERNAKRVERLDEPTVAAVACCYMAVRKKSLEEKNRQLFPPSSETYFDGKKVEEEPVQSPRQAAGWADTHHILMGDLAYEERKFLDSKATTIVAWLNRRIAEARERERERRRMK